MLEIGKINQLKVLERTPGRVFLDGGTDGSLALMIQEAPADIKVGETLSVFIYTDSKGELVATTQTPVATVGEFAYLEVASLQKVGAFLKWGLAKDLFLPFREQTKELRPGDKAVVYIYLDNSQRISASMRVDRFIEKNPKVYFEGLKVKLFIIGATELGFKAIINGRHLGVLYKNEVYQTLRVGENLDGYIQFVREDGKIDLSLQPSGYRGVKDFGQKILDLLKKNEGFLAVTDKSSAETIKNLFGLSKKKYKMTVGTLYKKNLITIDEDGIRLKKK
jgi:uncharacterized protein